MTRVAAVKMCRYRYREDNGTTLNQLPLRIVFTNWFLQTTNQIWRRRSQKRSWTSAFTKSVRIYWHHRNEREAWNEEDSMGSQGRSWTRCFGWGWYTTDVQKDITTVGCFRKINECTKKTCTTKSEQEENQDSAGQHVFPIQTARSVPVIVEADGRSKRNIKPL